MGAVGVLPVGDKLGPCVLLFGRFDPPLLVFNGHCVLLQDALFIGGDEIQLWDGMSGKYSKIVGSNDPIEEHLDGIACLPFLAEGGLVVLNLLGCDPSMVVDKDREDINVSLVVVSLASSNPLVKVLGMALVSILMRSSFIMRTLLYLRTYPCQFILICLQLVSSVVSAIAGTGGGIMTIGQGVPIIALYILLAHATKISPKGLTVDACVFAHA